MVLVALGGCAKQDTTTSEAKEIYADLALDPLWAHHSGGFVETGDGGDVPRCTIVAHSTSEREAYAPKLLYEGPLRVPWDAQLDEYLEVAIANGWEVRDPPHDVELVGSGEEHRRAATVTKPLGEHEVEVQFEILADGDEHILFSLVPFIDDLDICPD